MVWWSCRACHLKWFCRSKVILYLICRTCNLSSFRLIKSPHVPQGIQKPWQRPWEVLVFRWVTRPWHPPKWKHRCLWSRRSLHREAEQTSDLGHNIASKPIAGCFFGHFGGISVNALNIHEPTMCGKNTITFWGSKQDVESLAIHPAGYLVVSNARHILKTVEVWKPQLLWMLFPRPILNLFKLCFWMCMGAVNQQCKLLYIYMTISIILYQIYHYIITNRAIEMLWFDVICSFWNAAIKRFPSLKFI